MIAALFLSVLPVPAPALVAHAPFAQEATDAEVDKKIAEAGTDIAKLLELATAYTTATKDDAAKKVYKKIVELDPNHEAAHKALRHHLYDNKWFESYAELSKYRREETANMKAKGLAKWREQWVPEGDVPYLNMGWTKEADGKWTNPIEAEQAKQVETWKAAGYMYRADDSSWVAPDDQDKWRQIQWKCGNDWLDMAKADAYHAQLPNWWRLTGDRWVTWTTCTWDQGNKMRAWVEPIYPELTRLFGAKPAKSPHFLMLNSLEQYNKFAAGDQAAQIPQSETEGFSSLHHACFADILFDPTTTPPQFMGCGVGYWVNDGWAPFSTRFAAGLSYAEAIDPSWLAVSEVVAAIGGGGGQPNPGAFWAEKKIPRWLHYGGASYVERYAKANFGDGGNPWQMREDSFKALKAGGGLRKLEDIFAFNLDINDIEGSSRLIQEAGVVVSFLMDGADSDKKLRECHDAFKAAVMGGKKEDVAEAVDKLQKELLKNDKDIKKFADL